MIVRLALGCGAIALVAAAAVWLAGVDAQQQGERAAFTASGGVTPAGIEAAVDDLARMRRLAPDGASYALEAFLLRRARRREGTVRALERAVELEPDNVGAWVFLAQETRDPRQARQARRRARDLNPKLFEAPRER